MLTIILGATLAYAPATLAYAPAGGARSRPFAAPARAATFLQFGNPFEGLPNPFKDKRDGATAVSISLAFACDDRGPQSMLGQLDALAANADASTASGISALCAQSALFLLRRSDGWIRCCASAEHRGRDDDALSLYDRMAFTEAAKFEDRDSGATVDAALAAAGIGGGPPAGGPTIAVVSAIGCLAGDRTDAIGRASQGDVRAVKATLEELAAAANAPGEVLAFELLWVPDSQGDALDLDEVAVLSLIHI